LSGVGHGIGGNLKSRADEKAAKESDHKVPDGQIIKNGMTVGEVREKIYDGKCYDDGDDKIYILDNPKVDYRLDPRGDGSFRIPGELRFVHYLAHMLIFPIYIPGFSTSTSSNTSCYDVYEKGHPLLAFTENSYEWLKEDIAIGFGFYQQSLLNLLGCSSKDHADLSFILKKKYNSLFPSKSNGAHQLLQNIINVIKSTSYSGTCSKLFIS